MSEKRDDPPRGMVVYDEHGPYKVMGCIDGWVLMRRPRAAPALLHKSDFWAKYIGQDAPRGAARCPTPADQ